MPDTNTLQPVEWYYPTPSSDPVPCRWAGWVCLGVGAGWQWFEVSLFSE